MVILPIRTSSWFTRLPADHVRIGISRGTPRGQRVGFRTYRKLAPGSWFNSVEGAGYQARYQDEVLSPLNPRTVAAELADIAAGRTAVLLCLCKPGAFCHRRLAAEWLAAELGSWAAGRGVQTPSRSPHRCGRWRRPGFRSARPTPTNRVSRALVARHPRN